jgi:hypothetical protein
VNAGAVNDGSRKDGAARNDDAATNDGAASNDDAASSTLPEPPKKASGPVKSAAVVPNKASEDDPRAWGDSGSDNDHDAWLKEQRPPHWG